MSDTATYLVGDASERLQEIPDETAAVVCLDDAWARPKRSDGYSDDSKFGVNYPTHGIETTKELLEDCRRVLQPGGWVIADADDWLLPRLIQYFQQEWGDVAATYQGGGYRRVGSVTLTASDGSPDRSTAGMYLSNGGYSVVFAHKGETDRRTAASARQIARYPREKFGWAGVKPVAPYRKWLDGLCESGEHVVVPCAGTAPAAIAAEQLGLQWTAIDCQPEAKTAFEARMSAVLSTDEQTTLGASS